MPNLRESVICILFLAVSACSPAGGGPQPSAGATSGPLPAPPATAGAPQSSAAGSPSTPQAPGSTFPLSLKDDAGRTVTLKAEPRRIVSLAPSNTEILFALALGDRVVGVDNYSDYPVEATSKPHVGGFVDPDLERIVALETDVIVGTSVHLKTVLPELERRGLTVMIVDPRSVKGVLAGIRLVGKATGRDTQAQALADAMQKRVDSVQARIQGAAGVRVFYELDPSLFTAGPGSFIDDQILLAGGNNIAKGAGKEWPQLDQEAVLLADPEVIFLADHKTGETPERVAARPGWNQIAAVKSQRVIAVDPNLVSKAGPRVVEGLEILAKAIHPERMR